MRHINFLTGASAPPGHRPFVKMHGLENHFVIVDQRHDDNPPTHDDIVRICNAHTGVGGEQLLTIRQPSAAGRAAGAHAAMGIFNIDGREVAACGNATRCMAWLLLEETGGTRLRIETAAGILICRKAGPLRVSVTLGPLTTDWRAIPTAHEIDTLHLPLASGPLQDGMAVSIGNPHALFLVERLDTEVLARYAPAIQNHPLFPRGINVGAVEVVDRKTLRLAVWERPGMLTRACGTGACVAAFVAQQRRLVDHGAIRVGLPAGELEIDIGAGGMAVMTGPVAFCCHGFVAMQG